MSVQWCVANDNLPHSCADILEPPHSQPSKQTSFINNSLLTSVYVPTDMGLGGPATNQIADESVSEELSSPRGGDDSWAATDTEDDLLSPRKMGVSVTLYTCIQPISPHFTES